MKTISKAYNAFQDYWLASEPPRKIFVCMIPFMIAVYLLA